MTQDQQEKQPGVSYPQHHAIKPFPVFRKVLSVFGIVFFVFCVVTVAISIWAIEHRSPKNPGTDNLTTILVTVIVPILGVVYAYIQVHLQVRLAVNPPHATNAPPASAAVNEQSSTLIMTSYHSSLNTNPPAITTRVGRQFMKTVKYVCKRLGERDVTAVVLTGIAGVGKSTLAALVYRRNRAMKYPFGFVGRLYRAKPLWLEIRNNSTFDELATELFKYMGEPLPNDFQSQHPDSKAAMLINAIEGSRMAGLVVLDQFDNWLEWQTGYALPVHQDVDAWLNAINSQKCNIRFLLTSRIWPRIRPRGAYVAAQACTEEILFKKLGFAEAVHLLQTGGIDGTELELRKTVVSSDAHAGALAGLVSLLRDEPSLDFHSARCIQHWMKRMHETIFKSIFQQFDHQEQDLLCNFAVYRTPVPLQIALNTKAPISEETWSALDALLKQHLFQKSKDGHYRLHPIVASCTQHYLKQVNKQVLELAHDQAWSYYRSLSWQPRGMRQHREDMQHLLEAIWHLCQAGCKEEAHELMQRENVQDDLLRWGDGVTLLELQELLA